MKTFLYIVPLTIFLLISIPFMFLVIKTRSITKKDRKIKYKTLNSFIETSTFFQKRKMGESPPLIEDTETIFFMAENITHHSLNKVKVSLLSKDDDIRLLSFSLLSYIEKNILNEIGAVKQVLNEVKNPEARLFFNYYLAYLYLQIVCLGLSDKEIEDFYLEESERYCNKALSIRKEGKLLLLLGNIYLKKGNFYKAINLLKEALSMGMPEVKVLPLLAEAHYKLVRSRDETKEVQRY